MEDLLSSRELLCMLGNDETKKPTTIQELFVVVVCVCKLIQCSSSVQMMTHVILVF